MPQVSLVVCVYQQGDLLERLLRNSHHWCDDIVIVHDGPDTTDVSQVAARHAARFFERPRCFTHEPQWPFSWEACRNDWILLFDADEFPSVELVEWLKQFQRGPEPAPDVSGFTCIWPLWDGRRAVTSGWPTGRIFMIDRRKVRYFGMGENRPEPEGHFQDIPLVLHHQPIRKSFGVGNVLFRGQAYRWRSAIAEALMGKPTDLPCWRWISPEWPDFWRQLIAHPLRHSVSSLLRFPFRQLRSMRTANQRPLVSACLNPAVHHCLLGIQVFIEKLRRGFQAR